MNSNNEKINLKMKRTITAILLAVIVLLLICIIAKSCSDTDEQPNATSNGVISTPEITLTPSSSFSNETPFTSPDNGHTAVPSPSAVVTDSPITQKPQTPKPSGATPNAETDKPFPTSKDSNGIYSKYAYMINIDKNKVAFEKNADLAMYPASMTKIMTVIIALEEIDDYNVKITMDSDFYDYLDEEGASVAGFVAGERVTAKMLLYGAMLVSGAECCIQLARHVAGTEEAFYKLMNDKARDLGMLNTHYNSTTGLFNENNYTTVRDVAILMEYAIKNDEFYKIITSKKFIGNATNKKPDGFTLRNAVLTNADTYIDIDDGKFIGGKTGYIMKAGMCLASIAEINGERYILVTAGGNRANGSVHFVDANYLYNNF